VHTPDGSPCGLLNHLAAVCSVIVDAPDALETRKCLSVLLAANGMLPASPSLATPPPPLYLPVLLDGTVIGSVRATGAHTLVTVLRLCKVHTDSEVPPSLEVALIPFTDGGPYPGLYLFSSAARFARPVRQLGSALLMDGEVELIGSLEQAYLGIRCPDGGDGGSRGFSPSHEEMGPTSFLSAVASLTPWSDFNQSPRNMYQCQMAKQTMGTPLDSYIYRSDTKLYRIHTPQKPVARTQGYNNFQVDQYPLGTNAIVAVLAHTGYGGSVILIRNSHAPVSFKVMTWKML
jgi:DNA-directed RNA polymerase I subunit RPA2